MMIKVRATPAPVKRAYKIYRGKRRQNVFPPNKGIDINWECKAISQLLDQHLWCRFDPMFTSAYYIRIPQSFAKFYPFVEPKIAFLLQNYFTPSLYVMGLTKRTDYANGEKVLYYREDVPGFFAPVCNTSPTPKTCSTDIYITNLHISYYPLIEAITLHAANTVLLLHKDQVYHMTTSHLYDIITHKAMDPEYNHSRAFEVVHLRCSYTDPMVFAKYGAGAMEFYYDTGIPNDPNNRITPIFSQPGKIYQLYGKFYK